MDEDIYYDCDPYERDDDYNVFEENCLMEDEWMDAQELRDWDILAEEI